MNAFKLGRRQTCQVCATWVDVEEHGVRAISHNCHEESRVIDDILRLVGVLDTYCSSCRAIHSLNIRTQDTLRLFVTTSALAGFEDLDIGEGFHKETIAVSGARLIFLANRFRTTYASVAARLIILVYGGSNDAVNQVPLAQFQNHVSMLTNMVVSHEITHGVRNLLHFSLLVSPPCMRHSRIPMSAYNAILISANAQSGRDWNAPDLSQRFQNQRGIWREKKPSRQLHLEEGTRQALYQELMEALQKQRQPHYQPKNPRETMM